MEQFIYDLTLRSTWSFLADHFVKTDQFTRPSDSGDFSFRNEA
jgi:hypothetical protein